MPNLRKIASNPYYVSLLNEIESLIVNSVAEGEGLGVEIRDTHVKSVLIKVRGKLKGKEPKMDVPASSKDKLLFGLYESMLSLGNDLMSDERGDEAVSKKDWILCIETVVDSVKRHNTGDGSRGYLDFIEGFA